MLLKIGVEPKGLKQVQRLEGASAGEMATLESDGEEEGMPNKKRQWRRGAVRFCRKRVSI